MADISVWVAPNNTEYNLKDATARSGLTGKVSGPSSSTNLHVAVFDGTTGKAIKDSGYTIGKSVPSDAVFTDTTYSSKTAASGGTDVSLVTTGEKYTWNNMRQLPAVSSSDNGKVLRVVSGAWAAVSMPSASGVSF